MAPLRLYSLVFAALSLFLIIYTLQSSLPSRILAPVSEELTTTPQNELPLLAPEEQPAYHPPHPIYKPRPSTKPLPPVIDNFPFAEIAQSRGELPPIPSWNRPPSPHVAEKTPLLIGFTRNWRLLQQAVVGYITAGWPPEDIIVVENTGVMDSNKHGKLSLQNPFFLNHTRLQLLGVNVVITPTLFTFAQLQNFYLWTAIQHEWPHYFWSHMDVLALSYEDGLERNQPEPDSISQSTDEFKSLYVLAVETLRATTSFDWKPEPGREYDNTHGPPENWRDKINQPPAPEQLTNQRWAVRTFHYDHLALVQTKAYEEVGGWDTSIPFYMGDCDMHERLFMRGFKVTDAKAGHVYDVATALDDLIVLYRKRSSNGIIQKPSFIDINAILDREEEEEHEAAKAAQLERRIFTPLLGTSNAQKSWEDDIFNSSSFKDLLDVCDQMQTSKVSSKRGRNTWQARQKGGEGEPYHRDPQGFEDSINLNFEHSRAMYSEKWGHRDCDLINAGLGEKDAWRVEHDWD